MTKKLAGKVAVITGGTSGIGLATAQLFAAEGAYVFITGRRQAELDAAVKLIGTNVTGVQGDVSNLSDLDRLYATVKREQPLQVPISSRTRESYAACRRSPLGCGSATGSLPTPIRWSPRIS